MGSFARRCLITALCSLAVLPAADFTTYIGDTNDYRIARVVADAAGNTYVAGTRTPGVFVLKLDSTGKLTLFATLNGKGFDQANDLAVDSAGNLYLAGATNSTLLPLRNPLQSTPGPGFVTKFNADATQILFSTYFPAAINAMTIDSAGNLYVTGSTNLPSFPVTPGLPAGTVTAPTTLSSASGAFLTKLAASGDRIVYSALIVGHQKNCGAGSSCFLSSRYTTGVGVAVDSAGNAYLTGNTDTTDIPVTTGALLTSGTGAFVGKVNAAGTALVYLTYLGAGYMPVSPYTNPANIASGIAADASGNAYVSGTTFDVAFPIAGSRDAFVAKLNPQGSALVWRTSVGGKGDDAAHAIALDPTGGVWINGTTNSADFPNRQGRSQGSDFVAEVNSSGATVDYSSRFPNDTTAATLAIDPTGTLHFAGVGGLVSTLSPASTLAPRIFGIANAAYGAAGGKIVPGEVFSIYGPHLGPAAPVTAIADASGLLPKSLGGVQVTINGSPIPLLYVSDSQINAVAPQFLSGPARLRISDAEFAATVAGADPQIFQTPDGLAVAINQDGSLNSPEHPAKPGDIAAIWATGTGTTPVYSGLEDGKIATGAQDLGCCQVYAAGPLRVLYGGTAPGAVSGVVQVNFQLPDSASYFGDSIALTISAHDRSSSSVRLYVTR